MPDIFERIERVRGSMMKSMLKYQRAFGTDAPASCEMDLSINETKMLYLFDGRVSFKMSELAHELAIPLPTATHIVDRFVKEGLLKRSFDEKDRRVVLAELTEKGNGLLKKCMEEHKAKISGMLLMLDDTDKKKLLSAMETFTSVLEDVSNKMEKKMIKKVLMLILVAGLFVTGLSASDITLDDALKYAAEHNRKILAVKEKVRAAQGALTAAASQLWPSLSATGIYSRTSGLSNFSTGGTPTNIPVFNSGGVLTGDYLPFSLSISTDRVGDIYMGKLGMSYTLFSWGRVQAGVEISENNYRSALEDQKKTTGDALLEVKKNFNSALLSKELVKVMTETKRSMGAHVKTVQDRYDQGLSSKFDLLRSNVQLANIEPQLARAQNALKLSVMAFNLSLGSKEAADFEPKGELGFSREVFEETASIAEALANRAELKQMEYRERAAEAGVTMAVSGYRPNIFLTANYNYNRGQQMPPNDGTWYGSWDAGATISIPLFDGFATSGRYDEATGNLNQAKIGKETLRDGVVMEVRADILTLNSSASVIVSQQANVEMAKESLRVAKERYNNGLSTNLDVMDSEVSLLAAETNYLQALYDYAVSKDDLKKAMGR